MIYYMKPDTGVPMMDRTTGVPFLVKRLRSALGMTQEQFAKELGITFSTVNTWENGKRTPQPFLMRRLLELDTKLSRKKSER